LLILKFEEFTLLSILDTESLVLRAIIVGNFALAVDLCIKSGRMAEALIIASYGGPELRTKTQDRYFNQNRAPFMRVLLPPSLSFMYFDKY